MYARIPFFAFFLFTALPPAFCIEDQIERRQPANGVTTSGGSSPQVSDHDSNPPPRPSSDPPHSPNPVSLARLRTLRQKAHGVAHGTASDAFENRLARAHRDYRKANSQTFPDSAGKFAEDAQTRVASLKLGFKSALTDDNHYEQLEDQEIPRVSHRQQTRDALHALVSPAGATSDFFAQSHRLSGRPPPSPLAKGPFAQSYNLHQGRHLPHSLSAPALGRQPHGSLAYYRAKALDITQHQRRNEHLQERLVAALRTVEAPPGAAHTAEERERWRASHARPPAAALNAAGDAAVKLRKHHFDEDSYPNYATRMAQHWSLLPGVRSPCRAEALRRAGSVGDRPGRGPLTPPKWPVYPPWALQRRWPGSDRLKHWKEPRARPPPRTAPESGLDEYIRHWDPRGPEHPG